MFVPCVPAGEANLCECVRAIDFSTLGPRLGGCSTPPPARLLFWFEFDAIFVGFKAFGLKLVVYSWASGHLV